MAVNKVLVVDDSPSQLANLQGIIADAGYNVVTASTGEEAIEKAKAERPDIIFLDIVMPNMDGYEACRKLGADEDTKGIPVVFVTNKNQKADRMWAQMQGGKDLVAKPFTPDQIVDQLKSV